MKKLWKRIRGARIRKSKPHPVRVRVEYGPRKVPLLKEQIESWHAIHKKEMVFGLTKEGVLNSVTHERGRGSAKASVQIEKAAEYEDLVHTHIQRSRAEILKNIAISPLALVGLDLRAKPSIIPSKEDIVMYALAKHYAVKRLGTTNTVKGLLLSVVNRKGKEIGRINIEVPQEQLIQIAKRYQGADKKEKRKMQGPFKDGEFHQWAIQNKTTVKFIPSKGYEYNARKEIFVRERTK